MINMEIGSDLVKDLTAFKDGIATLLYKMVVKGDIETRLKEVIEISKQVQSFIRERERTMHLDELTEDERKFLEKLDADWRNTQVATTEPTE